MLSIFDKRTIPVRSRIPTLLKKRPRRPADSAHRTRRLIDPGIEAFDSPPLSAQVRFFRLGRQTHRIATGATLRHFSFFFEKVTVIFLFFFLKKK